MFLVAAKGNLAAAKLGESVYAVLVSAIVLSTSLAIVELFPAPVRVSGSSLSYNLAYTAFGGTAPFVAATLATRAGAIASGYYVAGISAVPAVVAALSFGTRARIA